MFPIACNMLSDTAVCALLSVSPFNVTTSYIFINHTFSSIHCTFSSKQYIIRKTLCVPSMPYCLSCPQCHVVTANDWLGLLQACFSALTCLGHVVKHMMRKFVRNCFWKHVFVVDVFSMVSWFSLFLVMLATWFLYCITNKTIKHEYWKEVSSHLWKSHLTFCSETYIS